MFDDPTRRRNAITTLVFALALAFAMPHIFEGITLLGERIPLFTTTDRVSDYLKGCLFSLAGFSFISILPVSAVDRKNLLLIWLAKSFVVLGLMLIYEANYPLDAYWYFESSQERNPDFSEVRLGNGTANIIAVLWCFEHYVISTASFHAQKVLCAFFGMSGLYLFHRALKYSYSALPDRFLLALCLFPSVLFWSSTLGKDGINIFGICLTFYGMLRFNDTKNPLYFFPMIFGFFTVGMIRSWLIAILFLPFVIGAAVRFKNILVRMGILLTLTVGCIYAVQQFGGMLSAESTEQAAKNAGKIARSWQRGGSAGDVPIIETPEDALKFLPIGMFTALFRPLPGEVMNPFGLLAGLESLGLLYLFWRAIKEWTRKTWADPLVIWFACYILLWSVLYAFISPQNLGASVRFRLQVLPAMLFLFSYVGFFKPRDRVPS